MVIALLTTITTTLSLVNYLYKPHQNIEDLPPIYTGNSSSFIALVSNDYSIWNNKVVEITGNISEVSNNSLIIDSFLFCQLLENTNYKLKPNTFITIKGIVIGYDELLHELKLTQCIVK